MKKLNIFLVFILLSFSFLLKVKANIMCNDGTESLTCTYNHSGCCSHHGGVYENYNDYDYEESNSDFTGGITIIIIAVVILALATSSKNN